MRSATHKRTGKDPEYLAFLHDQPCCIREREMGHAGQVEAAHIGPRGLSTKVPDRAALPMCANHHRCLHLFGPKEFWKRHEQDPAVLILQFNERFDRGERAE